MYNYTQKGVKGKEAGKFYELNIAGVFSRIRIRYKVIKLEDAAVVEWQTQGP